MGCGVSSCARGRRVQPQRQAVTVVAPVTDREEEVGEEKGVRVDRTAAKPLEAGFPELREQPADSGEKVHKQEGLNATWQSPGKQSGDKQQEEKAEPGGGDTMDGEVEEEEVDGDLIRVESVASGDLAVTGAEKVSGEPEEVVEVVVVKEHDEVTVDEKSESKREEEEEEEEEEEGGAVERTPVETFSNEDKHEEDEKEEEEKKEKEEEKEEEGGSVELTPVESFCNKDQHEEEEEEGKGDDDKVSQKDKDHQEESGDSSPKRIQPKAVIIQVKPVEETLATEKRRSTGSLKSSSSSSPTRIRNKLVGGDKSHSRENIRASGSLTQLKSTSATQVVGSRSRDGSSSQLSRSRESLKAASQAYTSVSRSRESLKKTESGSKLTSKSRESLRSTENHTTAEKPPPESQKGAEKPAETPLEEAKADAGGTKVAVEEEKEAETVTSKTAQDGGEVGALQHDGGGVEGRTSSDEKPVKTEAMGSKSSLRGSRVKLTSSSKRHNSGSKSSLSKPEGTTKQLVWEEGERKNHSATSSKIDVDKKTGQSESSIMDAVERSRGEEGGEGGGAQCHDIPNDAGNPVEETCTS